MNILGSLDSDIIPGSPDLRIFFAVCYVNFNISNALEIWIKKPTAMSDG